MGFATFMASPVGRGIRVLAGAGLVAAGVTTGNTVLAIVGLAPIAAGVFNICVIAPLIGAPFFGKDCLVKATK